MHYLYNGTVKIRRLRAIRSKIKIDELPDQIKREVFNYAEYLMKKNKKSAKIKKRWIKKINRGSSVGEMASETIEKMRKENKW